jgi:nucleoid-associated protein EbfC
MFGNLFGNFEQKQAELEEKTSAIVVETTVGGIKVAANGKRQVVNITILDPSVLADKEQLEDVLMAAVNRALTEAGDKAAEEMAKSMEDMLPPGFGGLANMMKGGGL